MPSINIDSKISITWIKNYPRNGSDLVKKINFILDHYGGSLNNKPLILYMYVLTALAVKYKSQGNHPVYIGHIKGIFDDRFIPTGTLFPIDYHINCSDSELGPDVMIFFDLIMTKSRRSGGELLESILATSKARVTTRKFRKILSEHYDIQTDQRNDAVIPRV